MPAKPKLLIVEDDEGLRSQYRWAFPAFEVLMARARPHGWRHAAEGAASRWPSWISACRRIRTASARASRRSKTCCGIAPDTKVIVATSHGDRKHALSAISLGAYDFCEKPVEIEVLRTIVERALKLHRLEDENRRLADAPARSPIERIVTADRGDAEGLPRRREARHHQCPGAAARRERHRQGGAGPRAARTWPAREAAVRRHQLRRHPGEPAGKRTVRLRAGRLHRRGEADHRQDRERQ